MIPKVIHYCWFGGKELPQKEKQCIQTWKEILPDYEIVRWDESNFDININNYVKEAYDSKKYAFVSDFARFHILYNYGGIYMDTDVKVLKRLDHFLENEAFLGFENNDMIAPGLIFGAKKENKIIEEIIEGYKNRRFILNDGKLNLTTVCEYTTNILKNYGLKSNNKEQKVGNIKIYPTDYFCPLDYNTGKTQITVNTHTIHLYNASWQNNSQKIKARIKRIFGVKFLIVLSKIKRKLKNIGLIN